MDQLEFMQLTIKILTYIYRVRLPSTKRVTCNLFSVYVHIIEITRRGTNSETSFLIYKIKWATIIFSCWFIPRNTYSLGKGLKEPNYQE